MSGATITLSSIKFTKTATSSATSENIAKFQLWHDVNNDGAWDSGDVQIGSDVTGTVSPQFTSVNFATTYGTTEKILLTVDISSASSNLTRTLGMEVSTVNDITLSDNADDVSGTFPLPASAGDYTLPVNLSSFTVAADNGFNVVTWITESEQNNAGFNIWRATGESLEEVPRWSDFQMISGFEQNEQLAGAGNSSQPITYSYEDDAIVPGAIYFYMLQSIDLAGNEHVNDEWAAVESRTIPESYQLNANYPNPFNPSTTISFALPEPTLVTLQIFNLQGQLVRTLIYDEQYHWGIYQMTWDGKNNARDQVASGVYIYRLQTPSFTDARKMTLLR
jgi:hypothetical protein